MEPLPELNFRGEVPLPVAVNETFARQFSAALADKAHLVRRSSSSLAPRFHGDAIGIELVAADSEYTTVTVLLDPPRRMLFVGIEGDIKSPAADRIATEANQLFSEMFPGKKLESFTRRQGMLGP